MGAASVHISLTTQHGGQTGFIDRLPQVVAHGSQGHSGAGQTLLVFPTPSPSTSPWCCPHGTGTGPFNRHRGVGVQEPQLCLSLSLFPALEEEQSALPHCCHHQLPGPLHLPHSPPSGLCPLSASQVRGPRSHLLLSRGPLGMRRGGGEGASIALRWGAEKG